MCVGVSVNVSLSVSVIIIVGIEFVANNADKT
jgi:hypothetical protein